jgi:hypothetical protein
MSIRQAIDAVDEEIQQLQAEREEIQTSCKHNNTHIVDYMWRPGATYKVKACKDCDKLLENVSDKGVDYFITVTDSTDDVVIVEIEEDDFNG